MMSASIPTNGSLLYLLLIFVTASFKLCYCMRNSSINFCPEIEKQSLLSFIQSLENAGGASSWGGAEVNCCKWSGVVCNNSTGHVTELNLDQGQGYYLRGKINPSIGNISHLQTLVLSGYGLYVDSLDWLSSLTKLEHLNLNHVDLQKAGNLAKVINSLPSLNDLSLRDCNLGPNLIAPPDHDVNVSSLTFLDVSHNGIESLPLLRWIFQLNELIYLDFSENQMVGAIPTITNATKLQHIDLSHNKFNSSIPDSLYLCRDLDTVMLNLNELNGTLSSSIANLTSLDFIDLSSNKLSGKIPKEISYMCKIKQLILDNNEFQGEFGDSFGNMWGCIQVSLEYLSLNSNRLSGELPGVIVEFKRLGALRLEDNALYGSIPANLGNLSSLMSLSLNGNNFTGNLPESLGELFNLTSLDISDNKLQGVVSEANFKNLGNLRFFSASGNHLSLKVSPHWTPPFQLDTLQLGSWDLGAGSEIPSWLDTQKHSITHLDLSNTGISGSVPEWIWGILYLNLSHNHLRGQIPTLPGFRAYLSSNQFNGSLPRITDSMDTLDLSNNSISGELSHFLCDIDITYLDYLDMYVLHLGMNQLSGGLPADCLEKWKMLRYLNIGDNSISGSIPIPSSLALITYLSYLNLSYNRLTGRIPQGTQLEIMNASAFIGNNLCGPPLTSNCSSSDRGHDIPSSSGKDEEGKNKIEWIYVLMSLGYAMGFSAVCTALVLNKSWRVAYFGFLEKMWDKLYVYVYVKWSRIAKPSIANS